MTLEVASLAKIKCPQLINAQFRMHLTIMIYKYKIFTNFINKILLIYSIIKDTVHSNINIKIIMKKEYIEIDSIKKQQQFHLR